MCSSDFLQFLNLLCLSVGCSRNFIDTVAAEISVLQNAKWQLRNAKWQLLFPQSDVLTPTCDLCLWSFTSFTTSQWSHSAEVSVMYRQTNKPWKARHVLAVKWCFISPLSCAEKQSVLRMFFCFMAHTIPFCPVPAPYALISPWLPLKSFLLSMKNQ